MKFSLSPSLPKWIRIVSLSSKVGWNAQFFANQKTSPIFLATGDSDEDVLPRNSIILDTRLRQLQSPVEMHMYQDIDHINIMLSLAKRFRSITPLREDITAFIEMINVCAIHQHRVPKFAPSIKNFGLIIIKTWHLHIFDFLCLL